MARKKKGCRGCLGCGVIGIGVIALVGGVAFWLTFGRPAGGLAAQIEAARKEGMPLEIEDILPKPPSNPKLNAAPLYAKLIDVLNAQETKGPMNIALAEKSTVDEVEKALGDLKPVLDLVEEAAARPAMVPDKDWSNPVNVLFPEFAASKSATKLLVEKAKVQARRGDGVSAMKTLARAHTFSKHSGQSPTLIGYLVAVADEAIILRGMESVLSAAGKDPKTIAEGRRTLASFGPLPNLRKAMGGEVIFSRAPLKQNMDPKDWVGSSADPALAASFTMTRFAPVRNAFDARAIEEFRRIYKEMPTDPNDYQGFETALKAVDDRMVKETSPTSLLLRVTTPVFSQAGETLRASVTRRKLASLAMDLCDLSNSGKTVPAQLQAKSDRELDPYSGEPFLVRPEARGFLIWSVGKNKIDDGGARNDNLDMTLRVKH